MLKLDEAKALWALGRQAEARPVAESAVQAGSTDEHRERIRTDLAGVLDSGGA